MIQLQIFKEHTVRIPRTAILGLFDMIYKNELSPKSKGVVNLIFSQDKRLQELNKQFRNKQ